MDFASIVFPAPKSTYTETSIEGLRWIPVSKIKFKSDRNCGIICGDSQRTLSKT